MSDFVPPQINAFSRTGKSPSTDDHHHSERGAKLYPILGHQQQHDYSAKDKVNVSKSGAKSPVLTPLILSQTQNSRRRHHYASSPSPLTAKSPQDASPKHRNSWLPTERQQKGRNKSTQLIPLASSVHKSNTSPTDSSRKRKSPYEHTPKILKDLHKRRRHRIAKASPFLPNFSSHSLPNLASTQSPTDSLEDIVPDFNAAYDFLQEHQKLKNQEKELSGRVMSLDASLKALQLEHQNLQHALLEKDKHIAKMQQEKQQIARAHNSQSKSLEQQSLKTRMLANYYEKDKDKLGNQVKDLTKSMSSLETMYRRNKLFHEEELHRIKTEYNVNTWKNETQHRFDQEVKLYKSLADDFETKWRGQQDIIDDLRAQLKERDETIQHTTADNEALQTDRRILKAKIRSLLKIKKEQSVRIKELETRCSFVQPGPDMALDASKLKRLQTADDGTQYLVEDDGTIVPIVREDKKKRRQRTVGVNGEFDESGGWVYYDSLDFYDTKLVGKKKEEITGETLDDGEWKWYLGFDPIKKIGKKIPGCTGFYDASDTWIWFDKFSPRNLQGPEKRTVVAKHEPLKLNAQSKIKSIVWNLNYKPRKWKEKKKQPDAKKIARAFV
uniref:Uncharacterized protein n=1 Tax=Percolomonas cosmopolitus TaxID=63605 RepID=A0A7S1PHL2_9EUKA|mmetsp:Transcript_2020/g.7251  ORF Transcript_2020/g.7251 Transcript_2020/m.7251 type:complete len:611 (+) Transcript_2020:315-2147(+)